MIILKQPNFKNKKQKKAYLKWCDEMQGIISSLPKNECKETQSFLKDCELSKQNNRNSFNYNANRLLQLEVYNLSNESIYIIKEFMAWGMLEELHKIVFEAEQDNLIYKEVELMDKKLSSNGVWRVKKDIAGHEVYESKKWIDSEHYELIHITRGVCDKTDKFLRMSGVFTKKGEKIKESKPIYSQYLESLFNEKSVYE